MALAQGLAPGVLGAGLSVSHLASPSHSVLCTLVLCFRGPCPFRCRPGMRPAVLHAAAIRVLRWVQGQPPAAGFCPAVAEKEACARGQRLARWPGSGAGLQKPPSPEARWLMVSWCLDWACFLRWHESLWVGGGHPVPLRPGASHGPQREGRGAGNVVPVTAGAAALRRGGSGEPGARAGVPSEAVPRAAPSTPCAPCVCVPDRLLR